MVQVAVVFQPLSEVHTCPQQVLQRSLNANVQEGGSALFIPQSNGRRRFKSAATDLEGSAAKRKRGIKTWTMGFIRR